MKNQTRIGLLDHWIDGLLQPSINPKIHHPVF